jgi:chromosome segregation ATPase
MDIIDLNSTINSNSNLSTEYKNKLNELNGSVDLLLDEFKQIYVIAKLHLNNEDIQEKYQEMISNINKLQANLFSVSNSIETNINTINAKLIEIDVLIQKEKNIHKELKKKLGIVEHTTNSSHEMINDYKEMYNMSYLRNWGLFLSIIIGIFATGYIYKKKT